MLNIALKEWSIVCDLLAAGRLALLLRKGGIAEDQGPGRFTLAHRRFALYPAWEHQKPDMIKPDWTDPGAIEVYDHEPEHLTIQAVAEVAHIWQVPSRDAFDRLEDLHCWQREQIDMRFNYKPDRPLYLLAPRVYRLSMPRTIPSRREYWGCRSWVPLVPDDHLDDTHTEPAMPEQQFQRIIERIDHAMRQ